MSDLVDDLLNFFSYREGQHISDVDIEEVMEKAAVRIEELEARVNELEEDKAELERDRLELWELRTAITTVFSHATPPHNTGG